jgi:hypothetical protein
MPVVLTGDVHHHIPSADRRHARESESELAVEYARIAEGYGLNVTLFVTGLAVRKDSDAARPLASMDQVEIGGHGWDAFQPRWLYRPLARASGSPQGYRRWQQRKIVRTCEVLERFCGAQVRSWRNHAYVHDRHTAALLAEAGIAAWSDEVDLERTHPYVHGSGLVVLPLNTLPDHENLFHGDRTPESVQDGRALTAAEWLQRVLDGVEEIHARDGTATVMAHPLCMKVVDDWRTFRSLCEGLAGYPSLFAADAARAATDAP